MADILIQGGEVLDPGQGLRGRLDIAVSQGKITQIALHIDPREAQRVVDVSGEVVVPGLIDLHAHVYAGVRTVYSLAGSDGEARSTSACRLASSRSSMSAGARSSVQALQKGLDRWKQGL
jgi:predicted amidohydrolase